MIHMSDRAKTLVRCLMMGLIAAALFVSAAVRQEPRETGAAESRSPQWPTVRKHHLMRFPACAVCDSIDECDVHHVTPVHLCPEKELSPENLITLCRQHHFLFGHLASWTSFNKDVREDAEAWNKKIKERP